MGMIVMIRGSPMRERSTAAVWRDLVRYTCDEIISQCGLAIHDMVPYEPYSAG
jgi:hypothetical protein